MATATNFPHKFPWYDPIFNINMKITIQEWSLTNETKEASQKLVLPEKSKFISKLLKQKLRTNMQADILLPISLVHHLPACFST